MDLSGRPVSRVERDPGYGTINHYVDADGNRIMSSPSLGLVNMDTYEQIEGPKPSGPGPLSGEVRAQWTAVGAGPGGEMRAPDGSVIGRIDANGNMVTHDGRAISGTAFQEGGRLSWFNTADGQHWTWNEATGQYSASAMPDGRRSVYRKRNGEWTQRCSTIAESDIRCTRRGQASTLVRRRSGKALALKSRKRCGRAEGTEGAPAGPRV
jgi:hypothetical protein